MPKPLPPEPLIEFRGFSFRYHAQAEPTLHEINLTIYKGEKILIVGPSGCGKSTLVNCLNGLIPFSYRGDISGSLRIGGRESREQSLFAISKIVGTVLQDSDSQFIGLTVAEDLAFVLENDCIGEPELHERVAAMAGRVQLQEHLRHAPGELSGGQKQRVAIGGILMDPVDLLLFDEPLANLDPETGRSAIELIDDLRAQSGAAVVIVEHRLEDALHRPVDRIILLDEGRIRYDGPPAELLCSGLLRASGIREPLYLSALHYAGIAPRPEQEPESLERLNLSPLELNALQQWAEAPLPTFPRPDRPELLHVEGLDFRYPNGYHALRDISLSIHTGELLAIVGRNGAGKSTLCKVLCGFEHEQSGHIFFQGQDIAPLSVKERADYIGFVLQSPNQMISETMIYDEVALGLRSRAIPENEIRDRVDAALHICGLHPYRNWPISALSFGQKKRVSIASILVLDPQILILDEPTAGQDYRHYTEIMNFLKNLSQRGLAIVLITHDMHLMQEYAERALVFSDGHLLCSASPAEILTQPTLIRQAALKETSLFHLAQRLKDQDPTAFVRHFMAVERQARTTATPGALTP